MTDDKKPLGPVLDHGMDLLLLLFVAYWLGVGCYAVSKLIGVF